LTFLKKYCIISIYIILKRNNLKLKDISNLRTGIVTSRKKASLSDKEIFTYKTVTLKSFNQNSCLNINDSDSFESKEKIDSIYLTQTDDILVRLREPVTAIYIDEECQNLLIPSLVSIIRVTKDENINSKFLAYYLNSNVVKRALESSLKGTTISMIKTKDLEDLNIKLPSLKEQNKIVEFLDLSKEELTLLENLKTEKEKYYSTVFEKLLK